MKRFKILKILTVVLMLGFILMTLTGCEYFDVQKEQQTFNEETIKYLNEKYSREESFKKYERKNIKKTIGANKLSDYICHVAMGGDGGMGCPNTPFEAANTIQMKDNTIVAKAKYDKKFYDSRQNEKIRNDFEKYYYDKFFSKYDYSENRITFLSEYYTQYHNTNNGIYNGLFNEYYEGNIEKYLKDKNIYVDGVIIIWINEEDWERECENIAKNMEEADFNLLLNGKVYFMNKNMKSKAGNYLLNNDGEFYYNNQEGLLGYLVMRSNYRDGYFEKYKKGNDNNIDNFTHENIL